MLGPYLVPAYRLASRQADNDAISFERAWIATLIYVFGVVIMLLRSTTPEGPHLRWNDEVHKEPEEVMHYLVVNDILSYICVMQVWFIYYIQSEVMGSHT